MNDLNARKFTIEQARVISNNDQEQMAMKLGMTPKTYIQYEKYRRVFRMDTAFKFVELTGINMSNVIFFEDQLQKPCS